ncbi:MAG: hypothetical protein WCK65_08850 [Rhodospirillaceae bacterium]
MTKKAELWVAFAEGELTCSVTVNDAPGGAFLEIDMSGMFSPRYGYVHDMIMDVIGHSVYDTVFLDVTKLMFFSGDVVNDCAVEQLLTFVTYFCDNKKELHLLLEEGCIKDVLKKDLVGRRKHSLAIGDSKSVAAAKYDLDHSRARH